MGQNQSDQQASIRAVTGTAWTYEGDWHALFDQAGIATGDYNGRLLAWINQSMGASYSELNGAMQAFAVSQSVPSWNEMGTFTPGSAPVASWDASTSTLVQLAALVSHSRTSLATMFDSTGKLTSAPNNLLLNTATLGTQTVTVQVGVNYILSIKGTGSVTLTGASTAGPLNGTGASNRVDLKITAATSSLTLTVSGSVTSARLSAVTYETAFRSQDDVDNTASAYYGPRTPDYTYSSTPGLLDETSSRTNRATYSQDFSNAAWTKDNTTVATGVSDPAGTLNAQTITAAAANARIYQGWTLASASYTSSVFIKRRTGTGAIQLNVDGVTYTAVSVTSSWQRFTLSATATNTFVMIRIVTSGDQIDVAFAQHEDGSFATSYIPTAASSVTRSPDALTAASLTTNPAIIQYRSISTGTRARKVINPWSGISSETDEWIEAIRIYPSGTGASYLNTKLTVDGPW